MLFTAIKDVFRLLDKDGSGTLDQSELGNALKSMGVDCGDREIEELMTQIDEDGMYVNPSQDGVAESGAEVMRRPLVPKVPVSSPVMSGF